MFMFMFVVVIVLVLVVVFIDAVSDNPRFDAATFRSGRSDLVPAT